MAEELISFTNVEAVLAEYTENAREIYRKNLSLGNKVASRSLIDSVTTQMETVAGGYEVTMTLNYYWKFVEGGTKGKEHPEAVYPQHMPPPSVIAKWIEVKPILPRPLANGRIPTPKQLSWAIAKGIEEKGIKPHPALAATIDELNEMYMGRLRLALAKDCEHYIVMMADVSSHKPILDTVL